MTDSIFKDPWIVGVTVWNALPVELRNATDSANGHSP